MNIILKVCIACGSLMIGAAVASAAGNKAHWGYEGALGPDAWAQMDAAYEACAADQQSPVDLTPTHAADVEDIVPDWSSFAPEVVNNGHTFQANVPDGNTTRFGEATYTLLQVHFHHLSEHTINGKHAPMEAHFVHSGEDGTLMVLGVMIAEGDANDVIGDIWKVAPAQAGSAQAEDALDLRGLLPANSTSFRYEGSLTTPPCSEIVHWVVFTQPVTASADQVARFADAFHLNNRPVQPLNRRFVLQGD